MMPEAIQDLLQLPLAKFVLSATGLLIVTVIGVYVVLRYRDGIEEDETTADLLIRFREMRQEGYLEEAEYRTIKTDLERQLSQQSSAESDAVDRKGG